MSERIPYENYYDHVLKMNPEELILQEKILGEIPDALVDVHVHSSGAEHYQPESMPENVRQHMMSTFPVTTLEQSVEFDEVLMPGKEIQKVRFAHAYAGIDQFGVNDYLIENSPTDDFVFAFGRSDTKEEAEETVRVLESGEVQGLKMYYLSSGVPKSNLTDYFPPDILSKAEEVGVPIMLHLPHSIYKSAHEVVEVAEKYPNLSVILAHLGVAHIYRPELDGILSRLSTYPNVYVDTSQVHDADLITSAVKNLGQDRVLFGTDEPLNLLRSIVYDNPKLGPRILTDYPYHWVNSDEYNEFKDTIKGEFIHSQWQQLEAILQGVKQAFAEKKMQDKVKQQVFRENALKLLIKE